MREIRDGVVYAARRPDLLGTYVVDLVAMFLAMPVVLFPALATEVLARPALLGLLYSAGTVGSLLATATSGWTARVHHHGRAVVLSAAAWGASVVLAGLTTVPAVVLLGLVLAGAFDMISGLFRGTIWHQTIPDSHRGRLAGIEMLSYTVGPLGGEARAGLVADATSVRTADRQRRRALRRRCRATAAALRSFWDYDARTDEHAVRERELRAAREAAGRSQHAGRGGGPPDAAPTRPLGSGAGGTGPSSGGGSARAVCSGSSGESASSPRSCPAARPPPPAPGRAGRPRRARRGRRRPPARRRSGSPAGRAPPPRPRRPRRGRPVRWRASAAASRSARTRALSSAVATGTPGSSTTNRSAVCTRGSGTRKTAVSGVVPATAASASGGATSAPSCTSAGARAPSGGRVAGSRAR